MFGSGTDLQKKTDVQNLRVVNLKKIPPWRDGATPPTPTSNAAFGRARGATTNTLYVLFLIK